MNRVLTTRIAAMHFAPTPAARDTLLAERVPASDVFLTGNTVIDALLQTVRSDYRFRTPGLAALDPLRRLVLVTTHRRESFGAPLQSICAAIRDLAGRFPELQFVLPVHPNPEVKRTVEALLCDLPGMHLVAPVDYLEFVHLMNRAHLVLTDSGGVQEEAPSLGKPVLVLREVTERPEGVAAGTAMVVGTDRGRIVSAASELLTSPEAYGRMANAVNPYGDGRASERILTALAGRYA
jgi:UDP-N-acetylglucosamine 2-epimerase (non-hydrolysing)